MAAIVVIGGAILLSVLCYAGTPPMFIAYGVAMTGIGMLTLTGNTISMDVFGPVADNANGIGEMGYDPEAMEAEQPGSYRRARQILADLDAVGNTTKAETKGIAIGSAVIAAVSLFSSFIAVIAVGSEDRIGEMTVEQYAAEAGRMTVAEPVVFVGFLIGGAVPFLFSQHAAARRQPRGVLHRQGVPRAVPRHRHLAGQQEAGLRARRGHLHVDGAEGTDRPGIPGHRHADPRRLPARAVRPRRVPGRDDPHRAAAGRLHVERRRRVGQREEADRGRHLRRQGVAKRTRPRSPATRSATR